MLLSSCLLGFVFSCLLWVIAKCLLRVFLPHAWFHFIQFSCFLYPFLRFSANFWLAPLLDRGASRIVCGFYVYAWTSLSTCAFRRLQNMSVAPSTVFSVATWSSRVLYSLRFSGLIVCALQWW